jgi:hypothetical protein
VVPIGISSKTPWKVRVPMSTGRNLMDSEEVTSVSNNVSARMLRLNVSTTLDI